MKYEIRLGDGEVVGRAETLYEATELVFRKWSKAITKLGYIRHDGRYCLPFVFYDLEGVSDGYIVEVEGHLDRVLDCLATANRRIMEKEEKIQALEARVSELAQTKNKLEEDVVRLNCLLDSAYAGFRMQGG